MYYTFTPNSVFKLIPPFDSEPTWQTSVLYSGIFPLIYLNETIGMVICPSSRFKLIILWPRMNYLVVKIITKCILWVRGLVPFWVWRHSFLSLTDWSVQFSHSVVSDYLRPHESQHARPPCSSPTPGVHSDSRPLSQWCHTAISSSVVPFSSCPQSPQHQSLFQRVSSSHDVGKVLEFQL